MIPVLAIPTLVRTDLLRQLLASIDYPIGHIVIIDNGRWWPRHERLDLTDQPLCLGGDTERASIVELPGNLGVAGSWNLAIKGTPHAPWWLIANDDVTFPVGALAKFAQRADEDTLLLSAARPPWACFAIGANVIERVGLFDERFHPAYFEDADYSRRCHAAGITPTLSGITVDHRNSSTLDAGIDRNYQTFDLNHAWHQHKIDHDDNTDGWTLTRRRALGWES